MFQLERIRKDPLIGRVIAGQYELTDKLGWGALSVVYKAQNLVSGQTQCVKFLHADIEADSIGRKLFDRELKYTTNLLHPNISSVIDGGVSPDGTPYLILQYNNGPSLARILEKNGPLSPYAAVPLITEICQGMAYAHSKGILHRDLKPSNVMIHSESNNTSIARIIDFGIAKLIGAKTDSLNLTRGGQVLGSLCYMSPERISAKPIDGRADIYSLGCLIYEILSGHPPFMSDDPEEIVAAQMKKQPPRLAPPDSSNPMLGSFDQIIAKCMEKDPNNRYQSMNDLKLAVENVTSNQQRTSGSLRKTLTKTAVQWDKNRAPSPHQKSHLQLLALAAVFLVSCLAVVLLLGNFATLSPTNKPTQEAKRL